LAEVAPLLDRLAGAGPFFAVDLDPPPPTRAADGPAWHPFSALLEDSAVLCARVAAVRSAIADRAGLDLAEIDPRAAASLAHLGLTSRLVSPVLGGVLLAGELLQLDAAGLWWRDVLGPVPLAAPGVTSRPVAPDDAAAVAAALTTGPAAALVDAVARQGVSPRVLWGNLASAAAGALSMLRQIAPGGPAALARFGAALFAAPGLSHAGRFGPAGFLRHSCCLYYRVPGGGLCGDCVLRMRKQPARAPAG
jgi:hypothetical protein